MRFFTQDQDSVEKIESGLKTVKAIHPRVKSRPEWIPKDWIEKETSKTKKHRGKIYINPTNHQDRVKVMPGVPSHPSINSRLPYVTRNIDGKFYDKYGNKVPQKSSEAHIPLHEFTFFTKEQIND